MNRRTFLHTLAAGTCLAAMRAFPSLAADETPTTFLPQVSVPSEGPNIILCMADDQGWGDTGYNGHPVLQTPNLDAMAAASLRFDRFYAAAPVCSPTRGSVLTGRHPNRYRCLSFDFPLPIEEITIAKLLKQSGYATGHFGKWHLGGVDADSRPGPAHGFDEWCSDPTIFSFDPGLNHNGVWSRFKGEGSMVVVEAALDFMRRNAAKRTPFLAVVWFASPHEPHEASPEDRALYAGQPEDVQHYYGEITAMDRAFGKLRDELRTLGIHENTILWYCSDNGGVSGLSATGGSGGKGMTEEGGLRVPALLEWPAKMRQPRSTSAPVVTSDILPTLLEIVGALPAEGRPLDGASVVPLIEAQPFERSPIGFWGYPVDRTSEAINVHPKKYDENKFPGRSAWLDWPWKLHKYETTTGYVVYSLYNLVDDPFEQSDVTGLLPQRAIEMSLALEEWQVSVVRSMNYGDYPAPERTYLPGIRG